MNPRVTTFLLSPPRITVENSNRCTKCNGKNTTKMLKSFSLKFQQRYKNYWGNKRGRTNKRRNTKFLQDLDLEDSPHKERDLIGRNVDLDLLFLFPQKDSRSIGGVEGKGSSQGQQWWRAQRGRGSCPRKKKGGLKYPLPSKYDRLGQLRPDFPGRI